MQKVLIVDNCPFIVDLCVKCSIGPDPSELYVFDFYKEPGSPCSTTLTAEQILLQIESQVMTYDFINTYLCFQIDAPPCPKQSQKITFHHWLCWHMEGIEYFGDFYVYYSPCDYENECKESFTFCYDAEHNKIVRTRTSGPTLIGNINCAKEGYEVQKPTKPGEISECYIYHTPCNP